MVGILDQGRWQPVGHWRPGLGLEHLQQSLKMQSEYLEHLPVEHWQKWLLEEPCPVPL